MACKQIYEEAKDLIWTLNTFRVKLSLDYPYSELSPDSFEDAQKHLLWSKFRCIHFVGYLSPYSDITTIATFEVAEVLSEAGFWVKRLIVEFYEYDEIDLLLEPIATFSGVKVERRLAFRCHCETTKPS